VRFIGLPITLVQGGVGWPLVQAVGSQPRLLAHRNERPSRWLKAVATAVAMSARTISLCPKYCWGEEADRIRERVRGRWRGKNRAMRARAGQDDGAAPGWQSVIARGAAGSAGRRGSWKRWTRARRRHGCCRTGRFSALQQAKLANLSSVVNSPPDFPPTSVAELIAKRREGFLASADAGVGGLENTRRLPSDRRQEAKVAAARRHWFAIIARILRFIIIQPQCGSSLPFHALTLTNGQFVSGPSAAWGGQVIVIADGRAEQRACQGNGRRAAGEPGVADAQ
jgi:hypothetical protein